MRPSRVAVPFVLAAALFLAILSLLIRHGLHQDLGIFVYPLDDAYIHLAVARNLALHGVWGISPYSFSGASSSPAWTLLLAITAKLCGVHLLTPLCLNVVAALLLLLCIAAILAFALPRAGAAYCTFTTCAVVLIMPLPGVALIGMEHALHSLATLALTAVTAFIASRDDRPAKPARVSRQTVAILLLAALACGALRYDSCFVICAVTLVLLLRRRVVLSVGVCLASAIGPAVYGLYSYRHSGIALPFSVAMKSAGGVARNPLGALLSSDVSSLFLLLAVALFLRLAYRAAQPESVRLPLWGFCHSFLILALLTTFLHAEFGPTSWLMRYEAYLYALDLTAFALAIGDIPKIVSTRLTSAQRWAACAIVVALMPAGLDLLHRAHHGWSDIAASIHDRYVEHLPQALLVEDQMPHAVVLANDIGFLAYYAAQATILDPLGLGSVEPVRLMQRHRSITPAFVQQWAAHQHAQLAILHSDFPGMGQMIPSDWILVESWCFPHNTVFLNHIESFYAPDETSAADLRTHLANFNAIATEVVRYRFSTAGATPPLPERGVTTVCPASPGL